MFHLEIISTNMTLTNQYMIIHVKNIWNAMQYYKCRQYFKKKQESWNTCKNVFAGNLLKISTFQTSVTKSNTYPSGQLFLLQKITHWTYTCQNPLALNESKRGENADFFL